MDRMLQFFAYSHLPLTLAEVSRPFCELAEQVAATLPPNPERTVALRKLLEAKDCAVRALLYKEPQPSASEVARAETVQPVWTTERLVTLIRRVMADTTTRGV